MDLNILKDNWEILFWIITLFWGVIQFFKNKKAELEIEKLKTKLELEKEKKLLNDKKFREAYEDFISLMFDVIKKKKVDIDKWIINFIKKTLLFAGPKTLKTFSLYRKEAWLEKNMNILLYLEKLIISMREDLWVSNEWLDKYDILQTFIIWNVKKEIEKIWKK